MADIYVDPSIAGDSGDGLSTSTPYGDLQYAFNRGGGTDYSQGAAGDVFHVKAGTAEVLGAALTLATYGTPAYDKPLTLRGYTTAANDGGIGEIDCNSYTLLASAYDGIRLYDMKIGGSGANHVVSVGAYSCAVNCELHTTDATSYDAFRGTNYGAVVGCNIHGAGRYGVVFTLQGNYVFGNYIWHETNTMTAAIYITSHGATVARNIVWLNGEATGIHLNNSSDCCDNNSIFQTDTGTGNLITSVGGTPGATINNNLLEGGSVGINVATIWAAASIAGNAEYNCTTPYSIDSDPPVYTDDNEELEELFAKSGANTFANRFIYFAPVAAVQGSAFLSGDRLDKGAVQHADPSSTAYLYIN